MSRLRYNGLKATLGAALAAAGASYSAGVLADSPLAYYRMGDTAGTTMVDSSGNGHDGSYNGSPTLGTTGLLSGDSNKAAAFTSSQWGQVNGSNAWFPSPSSFTVEAWIKPTGVAGTQTILASADSGSYPWLFQLQNNNLVLQRTSSGVAVASSGGIAAGGTYHVAATFDGTTAKVYINGALVASGAFSVATGGNGTNFYIGRDYVGSGFGAENGYTGVIDEVAIYSGVLTADKFASRYTNGTAAAPTVITFAAALTHSNGTAVPTIASPNYLPITLLDSLGNLSEIVWLSSYTSGATLGTVVRAREGTPLANHASGDKIVHAPTATDIGDLDTWHLVGGSGEPAFANSWVNYSATGTGTDRAYAQFIKHANGDIELKGGIKSGSMSAAAFTLPAGYRPAEARDFPVVSYNGASFVFGSVVIDSTGVVMPVGGANNLISLDGIRFRLADA